MKSHAVLVAPAWDATHPFVQHLHAARPPLAESLSSRHGDQIHC